MRKSIFLGLLFAISSSLVTLNGQWAKSYGTKENAAEAYSIQQTRDGGYVVIGGLSFFGLVMKLNTAGKIEWQKTYGWEGHVLPEAFVPHAILQTDDDGYIVAGVLYVDYSISFCVLLKLNVAGNIEWQKSYGLEGPPEGMHLYQARAIQQTNDGGYIVAVDKGYDYIDDRGAHIWGAHLLLVLKLNFRGDIEWQKSYCNLNLSDSACSIMQTDDGGYVVAGRAIVLKLNWAGDVIWQYNFCTNFCYIDDMFQTLDGGYLIRVNGVILKLGSSGNIEWQRHYRGSFNFGMGSLQKTKDGSYVASGKYIDYNRPKEDPQIFKEVIILKLDTAGDIIWQRLLGIDGHRIYTNSIQQTIDGGYVVAGNVPLTSYPHSSDLCVMKLNSDGRISSTCGGLKDADLIAESFNLTQEPASLASQNISLDVGNPNLSLTSFNVTESFLCKTLQYFSLTIQATTGGTTDPPPGTYTYEEGTPVLVEAIPDTHYELAQWAGDVSPGMESNNPLALIMDRNRSITANFRRVIYPPLNFSGQKALNRSLSQAEYINVLAWAANPDNEQIVNYRIYQNEGGILSLVVELSADTFQYWHRKVNRTKSYEYLIVAVNDEGREGRPAYVTVK